LQISQATATTGYPLEHTLNIGPPLILASTSATRLALLERAGFAVTPVAPRVDETTLREALLAEGASARDIADTLAEAKAHKVARNSSGLVIGCDQILSCNGRLISKASDRSAAAATIALLAGRTHTLHTAIVACRDSIPVWRHVAEAHLTMRALTAESIDAYLDRAWPAVADAVGCYHVEDQGIALFRRIEGEHTAILGLPLPPFIAWLDDRQELS
jgi:septum formation protein